MYREGKSRYLWKGEGYIRYLCIFMYVSYNKKFMFRGGGVIKIFMFRGCIYRSLCALYRGGDSDLHHFMYTRGEGGPKHRYLMFRWGDYRFNVLRERG